MHIPVWAFLALEIAFPMAFTVIEFYFVEMQASLHDQDCLPICIGRSRHLPFLRYTLANKFAVKYKLYRVQCVKRIARLMINDNMLIAVP